jgi:hypothetical protein
MHTIQNRLHTAIQEKDITSWHTCIKELHGFGYSVKIDQHNDELELCYVGADVLKDEPHYREIADNVYRELVREEEKDEAEVMELHIKGVPMIAAIILVVIIGAALFYYLILRYASLNQFVGSPGYNRFEV